MTATGSDNDIWLSQTSSWKCSAEQLVHVLRFTNPSIICQRKGSSDQLDGDHKRGYSTTACYGSLIP